MLLSKKLKLLTTLALATFLLVSIVYAVVRESGQESSIDNNKNIGTSKQHYIAYYFHGSARCPSCYKIEKYTTETINSKFANELKNGKLSLQVINVEEGMNAHFIQDYSLNTKSVVLSEVLEGKEAKWKNLEKIWDLLGSEDKFSSYIENELRSFISVSEK